MTYREFQEYRTALLKARPDLIDLAETNPWRALANLTPAVPQDLVTPVDRDELAAAWLRTFSLDENCTARTLLSSGVRHSLPLIFSVLTNRSAQLLLPVDVYPVYGQLAYAAGVTTETFPTIPELQLPDQGDWLLLPNPLKPAGRWLNSTEVKQIKEWLEKRPDRRLLLDIVYTFERQLHPTTRELLETGRTVLLHSLSKGWLHQQIFGVALVPECEHAALAAAFSNSAPDLAALRSARDLLTACPEYPDVIGAEIRRRRQRMLERLPEIVRDRATFPAETVAAGYLMAVNLDPGELLEKYRLFTAPLTIFGSSNTDYCVMSVLSSR